MMYMQPLLLYTYGIYFFRRKPTNEEKALKKMIE